MINSLRECNLRCGTSLMYRLWGRTSQKYVSHHKPVIHKSWSTYRIHTSELLRRTNQSIHEALPAIRQQVLQEDHIPAP